MADVKQVITGDSASAQKAYADIARQVAKLEAANQRMANASEQGARKGTAGQSAMNGLLERGVATLMSTVAAWGSVRSIVQAVNHDIEDNIALMDRSKSAQVKLGEAQGKLVLNTWKMPADQLLDLTKKLEEISRTTGVQPAIITSAAADLYATGQGDAKHKGEVLELAAKIGFQDAQQIPTMGVAIERIASTTGKSPKEAASLMLSGGAAAFIADPERQAEYLGQAMSGIVASSSPQNRAKAAEQAMEFVAGFTQVVGEDKGRTSRTQAINTAGDMARFFEEGVDVNVPGRSRPYRYKPKEDPGYSMDRLKYLQQHPQDEKLFEKYGMKHMEGLFESPMKRILRSPDSPEAETFRKPQSIVEYDAAEVDRQIARLNQGTQQLISSATEKKSSALQESIVASNTEGTAKSLNRESILKALQNTKDYNRMPYGMKWLDEFAVNWQFREQVASPLTAMSTEEIADKALGRREREILDDGWMRQAKPSSLTGRRKEAYEAVHEQREILAEMRRAREATEAQTKVLEQIRDTKPERTPTAAGAARAEQRRHTER